MPRTKEVQGTSIMEKVLGIKRMFLKRCSIRQEWVERGITVNKEELKDKGNWKKNWKKCSPPEAENEHARELGMAHWTEWIQHWSGSWKAQSAAKSSTWVVNQPPVWNVAASATFSCLLQVSGVQWEGKRSCRKGKDHRRRFLILDAALYPAPVLVWLGGGRCGGGGIASCRIRSRPPAFTELQISDAYEKPNTCSAESTSSSSNFLVV